MFRSSPTGADFFVTLGSSHDTDASFEVDLYVNVENTFDEVHTMKLVGIIVLP